MTYLVQNEQLCYLCFCKKLIIGVIEPENKRDSFQEDRSTNNKILRRSVYSLLDSLLFDIFSKIKKDKPFENFELKQNIHPIIDVIIKEMDITTGATERKLK